MFDSGRGGLTRIRWMPCQNTTANDIPGFAVMRVTGVADPSTTDNEYVLTVDQPNSSTTVFCVNGPQVIKAQSGSTPGWGSCSFDFPNFALYDSGDGTPALGDKWGPKPSSWKLGKGYDGLYIIGNPTEGRVLCSNKNIGGPNWIGVLQGTLAYGSSATVQLKKGTPGSETNDTTQTCYPWMMNTGDSIAANVEVVGCVVNGYYYVFNAACKNIYGS